jgi:DNA mismatch repair protein MutS
MRVEVKEWGDRIVFLYKIREGASDRSYGIQVARLAGLPESVTRRAGEILASLEREKMNSIPAEIDRASQISLFRDSDPIRERLQDVDTNAITPLEALKILAELKRSAEDRPK